MVGHIGLTPQSVHAMGGYKVQGKTLAAVCWEQSEKDPVALATLWDVTTGRRLHRLSPGKANALRVASLVTKEL